MSAPQKLERFEDTLPEPPAGWVTVEVAGCGVCHTDLGYLYGGVPTAAKRPLVLGHEIAGRVVGSGREVIVPAVSPCGECRACRRGRPTSCRASRMPGNHDDGGFATHVQVPERYLCDVPARPPGLELWQLAAVADALTTPWQAIRRAQLGEGDVAVVVGAGGVGGFLVELAHVIGARVAAIDIAPARLQRAAARGAEITLAVGEDPKALKKKLADELVRRGAEPDGWHIFECSGAAAGQALAWQLLTRGSTLSVVGFTPEALPLKLSMLMALDASAHGNWGCDPALYPDVLRFALDGRIDLPGAVERFPLADAPAVLEAAHHGKLERRAVLVPNA